MTSRCYFSLIRAQQEEDCPCSILLPQSLASTQVNNYQMLDISQISPFSECKKRMLSHGSLLVFNKWSFWPSLCLPPPHSPPICGGLWGWIPDHTKCCRQTSCSHCQYKCHYFTLEEFVKSSIETTSFVYLGRKRDGKTGEFTLISSLYVGVPL